MIMLYNYFVQDMGTFSTCGFGNKSGYFKTKNTIFYNILLCLQTLCIVLKGNIKFQHIQALPTFSANIKSGELVATTTPDHPAVHKSLTVRHCIVTGNHCVCLMCDVCFRKKHVGRLLRKFCHR